MLKTPQQRMGTLNLDLWCSTAFCQIFELLSTLALASLQPSTEFIICLQVNTLYSLNLRGALAMIPPFFS